MMSSNLTSKFCYGYLLPFSIPLMVVIGFILSGLYYYLAALTIGIFFPIIALLLNIKNISSNYVDSALRPHKLYYKAIPLAYLLVQSIIIVWGAFIFSHNNLTVLEYLGLALAVGTSGGVAIAISHELMHNDDMLDKLVAKLFLAFIFQFQFYIEHLRVHHNKQITCTSADPVFADQGESLYGFIFKAYPRVVISAWNAEIKRLQRSKLAWYHWRNEILQYSLLSLAGVVCLTWLTGSALAIVYMLLQSLLSTMYLLANDYIQHYGLRRRKLKNGEYEPLGMQHSWNSTDALSNYLLVQLPKHSTHHNVPYLYFETVKGNETNESKFPYPYMVMLAMSFVPPLWHIVMDPIVTQTTQHWPAEENS